MFVWKSIVTSFPDGGEYGDIYENAWFDLLPGKLCCKFHFGNRIVLHDSVFLAREHIVTGKIVEINSVRTVG
jgi:hypothetical protein